MRITASRIRSVERHLAAVSSNHLMVVGIPISDVQSATLNALEFHNPPEVGEAILPSPTFGPVSRYNAEGKSKADRTRPMEDAERTVWRQWTDWHGNHHDGYSTIYYRRYPRIFLPPPEEYFRVLSTTLNELIITTENIEYRPDNHELIKHKINLFLEIFGECEVYTENLERIINAPLRRLDWKILPPGNSPWPVLQHGMSAIFERSKSGQRPIVESRFEVINSYSPDFYATGKGGFSGYVVFGFSALGLYLMESIYSGNATYVFGNNWEQISRLTKAEILTNSLQVNRVVHRDSWENEIESLLG